MSETNNRPPYGTLAAGTSFEVRKFTGGDVALETNHVTSIMPDAHWSGKHVTMVSLGGVCHFAFTKNSAAAIDRAVAATNAGATTNVGGVLVANLPMRVRLPYWTPDSPLYFARESDTDNTIVYMWLSDEPGQKQAP